MSQATISFNQIITDTLYALAKFGALIWQIITWPYFLHVTITLFALFCLWLAKEYRKWNQGWLSLLIEKQISESTNKKEQGHEKKSPHFTLKRGGVTRIIELVKLRLLEILEKTILYFKNKVAYDIKHRYLPSPTSLLVILILFVLFFILGHSGVPYKNIISFQAWLSFVSKNVEVSELSNIVSILGGFVAIVFVLVIFIAESLRDSKNPEQKRVLLKVSSLWFLITLTTLSLLNFLWFKVTVFSLIFPLLIAVGIIYSFWRVIHTLIDPEVREENRIKLLKERIKRIVFDSVRERIGNSILLGKVGQDKEIKLEYTFSKRWLDRSAGDYSFIESNKEGWLSDINLVELDRLVKRLEDSAQQFGFSLYLDAAPYLEGGAESQGVRQPKAQSGRVKKVYLLKRYGEYFPPSSVFAEDSKVILALPKEFGQDQSLIDYVSDLVPHIFRFKQTEPASNAFRRELQGTKDQLIAAIRSVSLGSIEELKRTYLHLAETFLEILHQFGGGYSAEQAKKERGNIFDAWNEIRWLSQDIRELIIVAAATDNRDVISDIAFLPIAIAIRALQAKDHLLFQEFVGFSPFIYYLTKDKPDSELKSFMIDRSWRYLKELSAHYIEPQLKDRDDEKNAGDLKEYKDFALYTFKIFQSLLKATFDRDDIDTFRETLGEFFRLYRHFDPERDHPNAEYLERSLNRTTSEEEKAGIRNKIAFQRAKEDTAEQIKLAKEQVLFGITAHIFEKYRQSRESDSLKAFFNEIANRLPGDIVRLTKVFDTSRTFEMEDYWGWDDWERVADGEVYTIDVHSKLDRLYCVKALQILGTQNEEAIANIKLPHSRGLAYLAESLIVILDAITSQPEQWDFVLNESQRSKASALKTLLKQARETQEKAEEEYLKTETIDPEKLREFKKELHEEFNRSGRLRPIANKLGIYRNLTDQALGTTIPSWGYNHIDDKAALIKDWHVHYGGWGEQYGRGMAGSEDQLVFEQMVEGIQDKKDIVKHEIIQEIGRIISGKNLENPVVLQTLDYPFEYEQVKKSEAFITQYNRECPKTKFDGFNGYVGVLKLAGKIIPVIDVFVQKGELKNKVVVADLNQLGVWNQYSPIDKPEDEIYKDGVFFLRVADLNENNELRQKILTENPVWLQQHTDGEGYLRQRVLINLYEKFKFEVQNPTTGHCLNVGDLPVAGDDSK